MLRSPVIKVRNFKNGDISWVLCRPQGPFPCLKRYFTRKGKAREYSIASVAMLFLFDRFCIQPSFFRIVQLFQIPKKINPE